MASAYPVYSPASAPGLARFLDADTCKVGILQVTSFTLGSVIFAGASGLLAQDNSNLFWDATNKRLGIGAAAAPSATLHVVQPVITTGSPTILWFTGGAHTTLTVIEVTDIYFNLARTVTFTTGGGTIAAQRAVYINAPTYAAGAATTLTYAATMAIIGAPVKGSNVTLTATHGLYIGAGAVSTATASYGLTVNAQTGATANYAAQFVGGNVGIGIAAPTANLHVAQTVTATGALKGIVYVGAVNTNQTLSTEIPSVTITTAGRQWATGALSWQREILISEPTYSFVGASVIADAVTVMLGGAPIAHTNATLTRSHAIYIGATDVTNAGACGTSYALTVNAMTGATANYCAQFIGGNVGINDAAPTYVLSIGKSASYSELLVGDAIETTVADGTVRLTWGNTAGNVTLKMGQSSTADLIVAWNYNATPANAYAEITTHSTSACPLALQTFTGGKVGIGITAPLSTLHVQQTAAATGALKGFIYTGAVNTNQTLSTEIPAVTITTAGRQWATGALTTQREVLITQPTYSFVGASTITDAATLGIDGAPILSTNATITRAHALLIQAGAVGAVAASYGLTVNAQTGGTANYCAQFIGGNVGIGTASPTAALHLKAGTTAASTAPLKLTSGDLMTAPEAGAIEFLTDTFYGTITTGVARKAFAFAADVVPTSRTITAGTGLSGGGDLTANRTLSVDQSFAPTWTGKHTFANDIDFGSGANRVLKIADNDSLRSLTVKTGDEVTPSTGSGDFLLDVGAAAASAGKLKLGATNAAEVWLVASGKKLGFFGTTAAVQASAYTQTYTTADKTQANLTSATLTDSSGGSPGTTLAAITGGGIACENATKDAVASLAAQVNALRVDLEDVKQITNSLIDDLQAYGLAQ